MSKTEIILIITAFIALGFSLYRKYMKKDQGKYGSTPRPQSGSLFSSQSKDDDHEPYSKK